MHITTDAVVLRAYDNGKNSKLLILLTRELGRVAAVARGAGSLRSPLCAASGQFCYASFVLFRNADKYTVDSADIKELFFPLRSDVTRLAAAQYMCECASALSRENEGDEQLLRLLLNSLYGLSALNLPVRLCKAVFEIKAACISGYMPDIGECSECGRENPPSGYLDLVGGTLSCDACAHPPDSMALSAAAVSALTQIIFAPLERMFSFSADGEALMQLCVLGEKYFIAQTDIRPKTLGFLNSLF